MATLVHKANSRSSDPLVSLVLLDWECRERFHSLDWLNRQDAPRDQYEIIWVELFNRVVPAAMELADVVITCRQKGLYHKHHGYNIGLLQARGAITVICDSDAIYPPGFISLHPRRVQGARRHRAEGDGADVLSVAIEPYVS